MYLHEQLLNRRICSKAPNLNKLVNKYRLPMRHFALWFVYYKNY